MRVLFLLFMLPLFAIAETIIDVEVSKLKFSYPSSGKGRAGNLLARKINFYNSEINFSVDDATESYSSEIFVRKHFLLLNNPGHRISLKLSNIALLASAQEVELGHSSIFMNSLRFDVNGVSAKFKIENQNINLANFKLHCQKHPDINVMDTENVIRSCLYNGTADISTESQNPFHINVNIEDDNDPMAINTQISSLIFSPKDIFIKTSDIEVLMSASKFLIKSPKIKCSKKDNLNTIELQQIYEGCMNQSSLKIPEIQYLSKMTNFIYRLNVSSIENDRLKISGPNAIINTTTNETHLNNLNIDCQKPALVQDLSVANIITGCLQSGHGTISSVLTREIDAPKNIDEVLNTHLSKSQKKQTESLKNLVITAQNKKFKISGKFPLFFMKFNFILKGESSYSQENEELTLDVETGNVLDFLPAKKIMLFIIKRMTEDTEIKVNGNKIIVKI